jgi:DNA-binding IclR family transcriptional regulator
MAECITFPRDVEMTSKGARFPLEDPVDATPSRAVNRSIQLLSTVALHSNQPLRLVDIVRISGLPKSTAHRLLMVLCENGLLRVDTDGRYGPGSLLLSMGMNFLRQADIRAIAWPTMEELTARTQETCHLGVLQFPWVIYLEKVESPLAVRMHSQVGALNPLHCTGLGKALLAFSSKEMIDRVCNGDLPAATVNTITDGKKLQIEMEEIRQRGFAIDDVENELGIRCVGAPVLGHEGTAVGAISIAGPDWRISPEAALTLGAEVKAAARQISIGLGFTSSRL